MTSVNHLHLHHFSQLKIDFHDLTLTHPKLGNYTYMDMDEKFYIG